jgi:hypothetical protein
MVKSNINEFLLNIIKDNFMKLKKFRIKNYKSIVDSGDCY